MICIVLANTADSEDHQSSSSITVASSKSCPNDVMQPAASSDGTSVAEPDVFSQLKDAKLKPASVHIVII